MILSEESSAEAHHLRVLSRRVAQLEAEAEITRRLPGFEAQGSQSERIYRFVPVRDANFALLTLSEAAQVSSSAY